MVFFPSLRDYTIHEKIGDKNQDFVSYLGVPPTSILITLIVSKAQIKGYESLTIGSTPCEKYVS